MSQQDHEDDIEALGLADMEPEFETETKDL
jgi:hypothetical protein